MNNKLTTILIVLFCSTVYSQNIFSSGDRIFTDSSSSSYTRYEIKGAKSYFVKRSLDNDEKIRSGDIAVIFEGIPERYGKPMLYNGEVIVYDETPFLNVNIGDKLYSIYYRIKHNELDGLHYIDGVEHYDNFSKTRWKEKRGWFAVIAGNIVDTHRDNLEEEGHHIYWDYAHWMANGLNVDLFSLPFSMPETHKEEDLYFDLETMVQIFLKDFDNHLVEFYKQLAFWQEDDDELMKFLADCYTSLSDLGDGMKITAVFEKLESGVIAKSYGIDDDENIMIKVDPDQWLNADFANRWYILYHELGHDVLNFRHGQGGRMMFNYPTKKYSWEEFFNDRDEMFLKALNKKYPQAKKDGIQPMWSNY
ncbi:hypothetical protein N9N66_03985 [Schleiferiaceae bacterium]|nr:hypothetical protein [Schleiferiaceae bacterium]